MRRPALPEYDAAMHALNRFKFLHYVRLLCIPCFFIGHDHLRNPQNFLTSVRMLLIIVTLMSFDYINTGNWENERRVFARNNPHVRFSSIINTRLGLDIIVQLVQMSQIILFNISQTPLPTIILTAPALNYFMKKTLYLWNRSFICNIHIANEINISVSALLLVCNLPILNSFKILFFFIQAASAFYYYRLMSNPALNPPQAENPHREFLFSLQC